MLAAIEADLFGRRRRRRLQRMAYRFANLNILLVEDDMAMRMLIRDVLAAFEIGNIETANDGTRGYEMLRQFAADIVIVDWVMTPMNGLQFLSKVRNANDTPNPFVPAIMLTAFTDIDRVLRSRDAGITEFLAKPFTPATLYSRIVSVIEDQRPFVRCDGFFGPDRRRSDRPFPGLDRRGAASVMHIDASGSAGSESTWQI